jgi:hypothetical protein
MKSVFKVHFQGKTFNPSHLLMYQLVDVRGGQLIRELKTGGGVNHNKVKEWVKTVCARKQADTTSFRHLPLKSDQSQERHV